MAGLAALDSVGTSTVTVAVPPQPTDSQRSLTWPAAAALPKPPDTLTLLQAKQAEIDTLRRSIAAATALRTPAPTAAITPPPGLLQFQKLPKAPATQASSATQQPSATDSARAKALVRQASAPPATDPAPASVATLPPWTRAPQGGPTWPQQDLIDQLCRQGGPETTQVPPTRAIEMRLGHTASFDDQNSTPLYFPFTMLSDYGTQAGHEITRITTPYRMGDTKLLGHRLPNGIRFYFKDTDARDQVWALYLADVHLGLTISDYGPVPQITDCIDHKIIIENGIPKTITLSAHAFHFLRPDIEAADREGATRPRLTDFRGGSHGGGRGRDRDHHHGDRDRNREPRHKRGGYASSNGSRP